MEEKNYFVKKENRYRDIVLRVTVTKEEKEKIKTRMSEARMQTLTNFIRKEALYGYIIQLNLNDFKNLFGLFATMNYELNRIGVNVNQIAKRVNENDEANFFDVQDLKKEIEQVNKNYQRTEKEILNEFKRRLKILDKE